MTKKQAAMPWYAHATVATVIEKDGLYLLVEERDKNQQSSEAKHTVFNQPAGHLEPGENLEQAAIRETLEETAWHVELVGIIGLSQFLAPNNTTYLRTTFIAKPLEYMNDRLLDNDIIATHWLSYEDIIGHKNKLRSPMVLTDIDKYRAGLCYPLALYQDL